jgi:hypothetical protein
MPGLQGRPHVKMAMKMAKRTKKLTMKQDLFVLEYLIDLNATQAAVRAGYNKRTERFIVRRWNLSDYFNYKSRDSFRNFSSFSPIQTNSKYPSNYN